MENNVKIIKLLILLGVFIFCFSQTINETNKFILNYYNPLQKEIIDIYEDEFISNRLDYQDIISYKFLILNDTNEIFFDYQSEYGCLYINIDKGESINNEPDFQFCSEGTKNIFSLKKDEILEKIDNKEIDSLCNITINIEAGFTQSDKNLTFGAKYSLKVSLRKPVINIFKINSDNNILCKTEKITENNYRCVFMAVNHDENDKDIILYSKSINDINKLNIYTNFINKIEYDNYNISYLANNVPDESAKYTNYNKDKDFIIIPKIEKDKYIYISIESSIETTIELLNKKIDNKDIVLEADETRVYSINNSYSNNPEMDNTEITIDFKDKIKEGKISLTLVTLNGKGKINLYFNKQRKYMTDVIDNKLNFKLDLSFCTYFQECKLIINSEDDDEEHESGFIFYVSYTHIISNSKVDKLNELPYGKSSKLLRYHIKAEPLIFYQKIEDTSSPLNINFQIYNLEVKRSILNFNIEIKIISKKDFYLFKLDFDNFNKEDSHKVVAEGKFDPVLAASNIYLNLKEIKDIIYLEEPYLIIYIKEKTDGIPDELILGSTIFQANSLMYSSERIFHYGKLNNEEKIVYRLKGNKKYHLMRLEIGYNNNNISWTVKRTNNNKDYKKNDTYLSFVTESWDNGRTLLTMYIERGEDIYLTIFPNNKITNINITNFAFKYINSVKNGDFKNYKIKTDSLDYNKKKRLVTIKKLDNIPETSTVNYYIKIINETCYYKDEILKTISITESECDFLNKFSNNDKDDKIVFNITDLIGENIYYYINAYSIVDENDDYEYVSYSNIKIRNATRIIKDANIGLIIAALSLAGLTFLIIINRAIWYCCCKVRRRRSYHYYDRYGGDLLY